MVIRMKHEELEQILNDIDLTKEAPAQEPQRQYYYCLLYTSDAADE